jgi:hypothetical protein
VARVALSTLQDVQALVVLINIASPFHFPPTALLPSADIMQWRAEHALHTIQHAAVVSIAGGFHDWQLPSAAAVWPPQVCESCTAVVWSSGSCSRLPLPRNCQPVEELTAVYQNAITGFSRHFVGDDSQ